MTPFDDPIFGLRRSILVWGEEEHAAAGGVQRHSSRLPLAQASATADVLIAPAILFDTVTAPTWQPRSAMVVLTGPGRGYIRGGEIDRLWKLFRVPCFERLLDARGTVVAFECEAHDGMHLREHTLVWEPISGVLRTVGEPVACVAEWRQETCGCGLHSQKVFGAGPVVNLWAA